MALRTSAMFESWRGKCSDSPRAISQRLSQRYPELHQTWVAAPGTVLPEGVFRVERHSPSYFARLFATDFLVTNDIVSKHLVAKPSTRYLQTWHGTPLKTIGHDEDSPVYDHRSHMRRVDRDVAKWSALLSTGPECTAMFRSAFRFDGTVLETGLPRNDVLLGPDAERVRTATRGQLGLEPHDTLVLWTPTWRDDVADGAGRFASPGGLDIAEFLESTPEQVVLGVRMHAVVSSRLDDDRDRRVLDVSDHPDIAELYLAADILVSDYSSAIYDFAVTRKPIILLAHDLDHYRHGVRRLYFDYETWAPGPVVTTTEALATEIDRVLPVIGEPVTEAAYESFTERFCAHEDGGATDRVINAFFAPTLDH